MPLIPSSAISTATDYELDQSLRFNDGDSAYLSKTFASAGNQRTYTWSGWVKRGELGSQNTIFGAGNGGSFFDELCFSSADQLDWYTYQNATQGQRKSTAVFRDTSAWYHIVAVYDSTESTALNRMKLYVNGEQITDLATTTNPDQNHQGNTNGAIIHAVGAVYAGSLYNPFDGYLAEVNFIDGTAKTPADFGETGDYGEWKPIEYSGTYGTNGFYLPFKQDYSVEGFSTVVYRGAGVTGQTNYIGGTGFSPDLVWIKSRETGSDSHQLYDTVRGVQESLKADATDAELTRSTGLTAFNTDGFTIGKHVYNNRNTSPYVAWNWDMGGSNATNTDGSITSTVRANTTYGQSIVSYEGNFTAGATVGHGLSSAPEMIIIKNRESVKNWIVYHEGIDASAPQNYRIKLNEDTAREDETGNGWNDTAPTSSVFSLGAGTWLNESGKDHIAYCFHSVTGYSKFGSFTGNGSANHAITGLGFEPAFLLIKRTNSAHDWVITDNTRNPNEPLTLLANTSDAESNQDGDDVTSLDSDGFTVGENARVNGNGDTYIYMAFADKREYAYWLDQSGNNNDWTSNNLTESDISVDSPTNNFATFNPIDASGNDNTYSEGNLKVYLHNQGQDETVKATMGASSGKWYWEHYAESSTDDGGNFYVGIRSPDESNYWIVRGSNGEYETTGGTQGTNSAISYDVGDIVGVAVDLDNSKWWVSINGVFVGSPTSGTSPIHSNLSGTVLPTTQNANSGERHTFVANFGQDSSFAGNKTAQGNQDGNDIGDFYYTPPTGFLALCTKNLPDVAVVPSEHFNTVLWTGNGSTQSITGVGFEPNFSWIKSRSITDSHHLFDSVRGAGYRLRSDSTAEENYSGTHYLTAFNSDGFALGGDDGVNKNTATYAAWNWKANGSGSSNTDGSITSTVSANADAGFSIVSYVGNTTAGATVGHGLSSAPEMIIIKNRDRAYDWIAWHEALADDHHLKLHDTHAAINSSTRFNSTDPSSTVFTLGSQDDTNGVSGANDDLIAYCFHSVDGYSKVGSYTGNGNADGTFVYTGFRPAFVMVKRTDATEGWTMVDNERVGYNPDTRFLYPNESSAEETLSGRFDIVSNGFKMRNSWSKINTSGGTYIYLAFAETPFKYSNAR